MNGYEALINSLIEKGYLKSPEIVAAMRSADRAAFIPEEYKFAAYDDTPIEIGFNQVSSQPLTMAFMMELLSPKKGDRILDVGTGSGWQAAMIAYVVGDSGKVVTIERIPELHEFAVKSISEVSLPGIIEPILGDASLRDTVNGMVFDKIISTAEAEEVPQAWKDILTVGGRMVIPIGGSLVVADKIAADSFKTREFLGFGFTPLISGKTRKE
ncbi:MAG: protein-L-isoaspartate O-methyltransferase [Candidatus Colwellbacteria bacterium]|nr:protein-L-isoaspartate O-methyltransferase [Candidatus Colwellbacteria bacterium]